MANVVAGGAGYGGFGVLGWKAFFTIGPVYADEITAMVVDEFSADGLLNEQDSKTATLTAEDSANGLLNKQDDIIATLTDQQLVEALISGVIDP